jgi:hypothetical protein
MEGIDNVEYATLEWVDWFNHRRLLEPIGDVPPDEFEADYWSKEDSHDLATLRDPEPPVNPARFTAGPPAQQERDWTNLRSCPAPRDGDFPSPGAEAGTVG